MSALMEPYRKNCTLFNSSWAWVVSSCWVPLCDKLFIICLYKKEIKISTIKGRRVYLLVVLILIGDTFWMVT